MANLANWIISPTVFWAIWTIQALFMVWWLLDDMKLQYVPVNPAVYAGWFWVIIAAVLYLSHFKVAAAIMVGITAAPLAFMGLFILVIAIASLFGPIRWN